MKIRNGFVSNSSSSSFVIKKRHLSSEQMYRIKNHIAEATRLDQMFADKSYEDEYDDDICWDPFNTNQYEAWAIEEKSDIIMCSTSMDNFNMYRFLEVIGIPKHIVKREDY